MKIAVISDIHSNFDALKKVLEDIREKGIDEIYCTGDLIGYYHDPNGVIDLIKEYEVITIQGNHDQKYLRPLESNLTESQKMDGSFYYNHTTLSDENRVFLETCPESLTVTYNHKTLLFVHGSINNSSEYLYPGDEKLDQIAKELECDGLVFGHTHLPYFEMINDKVFINPGSVGKPKQENKLSSYATIDISETIDVEHFYVSYDQSKIKSAIQQENYIASKLLDTL